MRITFLAAACIMMTLGLTLGFGYYGNDYGYGKYGQEVFYTLDNQSGGFDNGFFVAFLILLFLISFVINSGLFNTSASTPTVSFTTSG